MLRNKSMQHKLIYFKAPAKPPRLKKLKSLQLEREDRCSFSQLCHLTIESKDDQDNALEVESLGILSIQEQQQTLQEPPPTIKQPRKRRVAPQPPPKPPPKPKKKSNKIGVGNPQTDDHCAFIEKLFAATSEQMATEATNIVAGKLRLSHQIKKNHMRYTMSTVSWPLQCFFVMSINIIIIGYVSFPWNMPEGTLSILTCIFAFFN